MEMDNKLPLSFQLHRDCRYFKGDLPCVFLRPCNGCEHYSPVNRRVLIVMLIKLGDMLIASALPRALKEKVPGTHVSWLVHTSCVSLVKLNPFVDEVYEYNWESLSFLEQCSFDLVLGFERERAAAALVEKISAKDKKGLAYGGEHNGLYPLCSKSEYFFKLNVWNYFRTKLNSKTWTEFYFELAGLNYNDEPYQLQIPMAEKAAAKVLMKTFELEPPTKYLLFNLGGSLSYKVWPLENWIELIEKVCVWNYKVVLTYGKEESVMATRLMGLLAENIASRVTMPDTTKDIGVLAELFESAQAIVTGDTFGLHLAIWTDRPTVAMFGPSNPAEVIPKRLGKIEVVQSGFSCSPCAHTVVCGGIGGCMGAISTGVIIERLRNCLNRIENENILET